MITITGHIKKINPKEKFSETFEKQELVLETDEEHSQMLLIEFYNFNTYYLDKFSEGQKVEISINLRGREWKNQEGKLMYFNSIVGWKMKAV